jgi:hypothetical protein
MIIVIVITTAIMTGNEHRIWIYDLLKVCVRLYASTTLQGESPRHVSGWKVSERSTKPSGFTVPHYFYIHNISSHDFGAIQTPRAEIYIFTMGTPYKISSRALLPPSLRTGIFTVECACPEPFRRRNRMDDDRTHSPFDLHRFAYPQRSNCASWSH